jgi:cytochrome c peroxidase
MRRRLATALAAVGLVACATEQATLTPPEAQPEPAWDEPLRALEPIAPGVPARIALGERLFSDRTLSSNGSVSCADCHPLARAGTDGLAHSRTAGGRDTALNTPTILNLAYVFRYNWTGAYERLEDEFDAPVQRTMGTNWTHISEALRAEADVKAGFEAAYPSGITTENVKDALASYIKTLVTPDSRFDAFLRGDADALSVEERRGYGLFKSVGCVGCHQGAAVGGNLFQRFGVMEDYFKERGRTPTPAEQGRYQVTNDPMDRFVFRVPSLRNVAKTAPYFHDGSADTLEDAVAIMGRVQLGLNLEPGQISDIASFLRTLTGQLRGKAL